MGDRILPSKSAAEIQGFSARWRLLRRILAQHLPPGESQVAQSNLDKLAHATKATIDDLMRDNGLLRRDLHAARAEVERLRAENEDLRAELDDAKSVAVGHWRQVERLRARVAEMEARPTVHPLAWARLRAEATAYRYEEAWEDWFEVGCPLTATGGEVLAPGEDCG